MRVETLAISEFKATCLAVLERVRRTGEPVLVTRRGVPVAEIVPVSRPNAGARKLGAMEGTGRLIGDVMSPAVTEDEWEGLTP